MRKRELGRPGARAWDGSTAEATVISGAAGLAVHRDRRYDRAHTTTLNAFEETVFEGSIADETLSSH